jgi:hypothetical protein
MATHRVQYITQYRHTVVEPGTKNYILCDVLYLSDFDVLLLLTQIDFPSQNATVPSSLLNRNSN